MSMSALYWLKSKSVWDLLWEGEGITINMGDASPSAKRARLSLPLVVHDGTVNENGDFGQSFAQPSVYELLASRGQKTQLLEKELRESKNDRAEFARKWETSQQENEVLKVLTTMSPNKGMWDHTNGACKISSDKKRWEQAKQSLWNVSYQGR